MDNTIKQQLEDRIAKSQNILIAVSKNSSIDATAAGLALYLSLKKLEKSVSISAKDPTVADAQMLYAIDKIGKNSEKKDLVINIAHAVDNVDKVTYSLEGDNLKIIIHAFADSKGVSTEEITFDRTSSNSDVIISLGYASLDELKNDLTHEQEISSNTWIININTSTPAKKFAQLDISDPNATGISEIVASFFQLMALPVDEDIAFNLYTGLAASSQMFSPKVVTPNTFQVAMWLLKFGAGKASFANKQEKPFPKTDPPAIEALQEQTSNTNNMQTMSEIYETPQEQIEAEKQSEKDWLKPPKIYRGSKSFDIES